MPRIATLTLNPTIDGSSEADTVQHTHKVRTRNERFDAGGGGINVARVLARLGNPVEAVYLAGGVTGPVLDGLLGLAGLNCRRIAIAGDTRISLAVHERQSGKEYRFVPQGPLISEAEGADCLAEIERLDCDWLVLSGSLPRGLADDFYARAGQNAKQRGIRVALDTSGPALKAALAGGNVDLVKPSLGEMEQLVGRKLPDRDAIAAAARSIVDSGAAAIVAVSCGHEGAVLVHREGALALPALPVEVRSAVGAGDSFMAGMTHGLIRGWPVESAFRLGIAAGTAAVLSPGTDLCQRDEVVRQAARLGLTSLD